MDRRTCLKLIGTAGFVSLTGKRSAKASETEDTYGILVDLTACIGCRTCEQACAFEHDLPMPPEATPEEEAGTSLAIHTTSPCQWTAVNSHQTDQGEVFVKRQCMHCVTPACATSCLTKALEKTKEGPVVWHADKCMGCRYCMVACPFDVPKFEYDSPVPKMEKCRMCWEKVVEGEVPACVDFCIGEALKFGKRSELLEMARQRIYQNPGKYVSHIYGEYEAGGTGVLYISAVPFEQLGFPTHLDDVPMAEHTRGFLTSVPVVLTLVPAFLFGLRQATKQTDHDSPNSRAAEV
jgi:Fe-S-cluster-containing dehydrogenase component